MKTFTSIDEILDFAIAREIEAEKFYRKLASWADDQKNARRVRHVCHIRTQTQNEAAGN